MNNKIFVRVMCILLGVLMVGASIALIISGIAPSCAA